MDIHEARGLNPGAHGPLNIDRPIDAITNSIKQLEVPSTDGISWHSAIHRLDIDGVLNLLNPPSRRKSIIRALVQLVDLAWRQGRDELPDVDEIELLFPYPLLGNIVDFKDAVWWHPLLGWWKEVHAADYEIREFGRNVDCPVTLPGRKGFFAGSRECRTSHGPSPWVRLRCVRGVDSSEDNSLTLLLV